MKKVRQHPLRKAICGGGEFGTGTQPHVYFSIARFIRHLSDKVVHGYHFSANT